MRRLVFAVVVALSVPVAWAEPTIPRALDVAPLARRDALRAIAAATDRVVALGCGLASNAGTGVVLADGRLVTNRHVVEGALLLNVVPDAGAVAVPTAAVSPVADLAVLTPAPGTRRGLSVALTDPRPGERLLLAGYPAGGPDLVVAGARLVDYVDGAPAGQPGRVMRLAFSAPRGMSGGPVLDRAGNLAGMLFAVERDTGRSLALPASTLRRALAGTFGPASRCTLTRT